MALYRERKLVNPKHYNNTNKDERKLTRIYHCHITCDARSFICQTPESRPLESVITPLHDPDLRQWDLEFAMFYLSQAAYVCRVSRNRKQERRHENNKTALTPTAEPFYQFYQTTRATSNIRKQDHEQIARQAVKTLQETHEKYTTMGKGSCYCGKIAFSYTGEPANKASASPSLPCHPISLPPSLLTFLPGHLPLHRLPQDLRLSLHHQPRDPFLFLLPRLGHTQKVLRKSRLRPHSHHCILR